MFMWILKIILWLSQNEIKIALFPVSNVQIFMPLSTSGMRPKPVNWNNYIQIFNSFCYLPSASAWVCTWVNILTLWLLQFW